MIYQAPAGPVIAGSILLEHDWGTVPLGETIVFMPVPFNAPGVEVTKPYMPCPVLPMPLGSMVVCAPANVGGVPSVFLQCFNFTGGPLLVGVKQYSLFFYNLRDLL